MPNSKELWLLIKAKNMADKAFTSARAGMSKMTKVGKQTAKVLNAGFKALKSTISAISGAVKKALKAMLLPLAALAGGFVLAVREAGSFEQAMANVGSVLGADIETIDRLSRAAREMGKATIFNAQEAAKSMYDLASAGFNADQVIDALKGTMMLAAATASDLTFTTETVTSTIKQFGLVASDAERVANVFAATISFSKMNMDKLATSMAYAGPIASGFGHELEATAAVLAQFANLGLQASMIGTTFRQGLLQLQRAMPAEEIEKGADVLKRLGITFRDIDPAMNSVANIVGKLHGRVTKMSEAVALFGVRAGGPFLKLIKAGAAPLREFERKITGTRKAFEMSEIQIATFYGSLKLFKSAIKEAQISLGTAFLPALTKIVDTFTHWVNIINEINWSDWWKGFRDSSSDASKHMGKLAELFGEGGAIRRAIVEWIKFFVSAIKAIAKIIWIPLEAEFKIMADRMMTELQKRIGAVMLDVPFMGGAGKKMIQQAQAKEEAMPRVIRERGIRQRAEEQRAIGLEELKALTPTTAKYATTGALGQLVHILQGPAAAGESIEKATKEEQKVIENWGATVVDAFGKTVNILTQTKEELINQIANLEAKVGQLDIKARRYSTTGVVEIGALQ